MANQEHLDKLKEGVEAWNQWREENPGLEPDLQNANLRRAQLHGVVLNQAQLEGAKLRGAQLQNAYLNSAQLQGANLSAAQLQNAYLRGAQLQKADLSIAQLQEAHLSVAQLQEALLRGAQLQGADLHGAFFDNATSLKGVILEDDKYGGALLADINWGGVNLAVVDWSPLKMLGDEYQARQSTSREDYRTAVRANRQLAVVLRDQGLNEDADRFAYRAQVLQRKVLWMQKKFGRGFFPGFLALVSGYGYRMERILFTYAIVVSLFAAAYFILGMYYPPPIPLSQAFFESITAFHGRVFFEQFSLNTPQIWVTAGEAIAGLVVEGVFIAMLTQRFFGR